MNRQDIEGIWRYQNLLPEIPSKYRLTLGEGNTTLKRVRNILFKCEYENPTGSVKDRGMAYQISKLFEKGIIKAVISSSGNAAFSAESFSRLANIDLCIFISPKISRKKLKLLKRLNCRLVITQKPVSGAFKYARENNAYNLRQSKDQNALNGYTTLAFELHERNQDIDAVFIPVSSGTTLVGLAEGFSKLGRIPSIHAVQTEAVHPVSSLFDKSFVPERKSLADAIVARYTPLQDEVTKIIRQSRGSGWVISDEEIVIAGKWLLSYNLKCSHEGALVLAAYWKAKKKGYHYKNPVCILTGKEYQ